jgi:hypothetical protein
MIKRSTVRITEEKSTQGKKEESMFGMIKGSSTLGDDRSILYCST